MALTRRSTQRMSASIWPGFVDAMTALLLVLMFVLTIFMIVQFMLRETITGQESELDLLTAEISSLAEALGLEQQRSFQLEEQVLTLGTTIDRAREKADAQAALIASLTEESRQKSEELANREARIASFEQQVASLLAQRDTALAQRDAALSQRDTALSERDTARQQGDTLARQLSDLQAERGRLISQQEALNLALARARDEIDAQAETGMGH